MDKIRNRKTHKCSHLFVLCSITKPGEFVSSKGSNALSQSKFGQCYLILEGRAKGPVVMMGKLWGGSAVVVAARDQQTVA